MQAHVPSPLSVQATTTSEQKDSTHMAKADKSAASNSVNAANTSAPEGFVSLGTDRLFYDPELCGDVRLQGYLMEAVEMGADSANGPFTALVIRTTKDTVAVEGEKKAENVVPVPAGEEVLIIATERLQKLIPFAQVEDKVAEVAIDVIGKLDIGKGKTMWRYKTFIAKKPTDRAELFAMLMGIDTTTKSLPASKGA